jgi:hypothetical protein
VTALLKHAIVGHSACVDEPSLERIAPPFFSDDCKGAKMGWADASASAARRQCGRASKVLFSFFREGRRIEFLIRAALARFVL